MSARRMSVRAPAKINPWLEVLGRRDDGYHELRTWMIALELSDRLDGELDDEAAPGAVALTIDGPAATPDIPLDDRNLAVRAAGLALAEAARRTGGRARGLRLRLTKEVPSQAGLGGGSADAAAALWLVEALHDVDLGADWRRERLAELGSDTVFFDAARGRGAGLCTGRGEIVAPADAPDPAWWVTLVTPDVVCPTGAIFRALGAPAQEPGTDAETGPETGAERERRLACPHPDSHWTSGPVEEAVPRMHNDLEAAALRAVPELGAWHELLTSPTGVGWRRGFQLSGSGSSFFALRPSAFEATALLDEVLTGARERGLGIRGRWVTRTDRCEGRPRVTD